MGAQGAFGVNVKCSSPPGIQQDPPAPPKVSLWPLYLLGVEGRSCFLALVFAEALTRLSHQELLLLHNMGLLQCGTVVSQHEGRGAGVWERSDGGLRAHAWGSFNPASRILSVFE